ncbi:MAG: carbon storage regulator CsrA [Candidatus Latescibacteria bacterium]|nr:carbon storage regulator CsrA [Candidatus Latescibacterota bacterium]
MLVLSRKAGQKIHIGSDILITIIDVSGKFVKIGINAPESINVLRSEIKEMIERENKLAAKQSSYIYNLSKFGNIFLKNKDMQKNKKT